MNINEITAIMEGIADPNLASEWDNCGMQVVASGKKIEKALIALEVVGAVIEEAKVNSADIIITHHPLIFDPLRRVDYNTVTGSYIVELVKSGISVYSAHTNFDAAEGGNNDYIASLLTLANVKKFEREGTCRSGELLMRMSFREVCSYVKDMLKLEYLSAVGSPMMQIRTVGVCCGSGGSMIDAAIDSGCDLFITGDVKYHDARYAIAKGICLIDAGHYGTEKFFVKNCAEKLEAASGGRIEVLQSSINIEPFSIF